MTNPKQQITKVFQTTCINAIKEKSFSLFSENDIILLSRYVYTINRNYARRNINCAMNWTSTRKRRYTNNHFFKCKCRYSLL